MKKKETKVADFARKLVGPSGGVNCQPRSAESGNLSIPFSHRHFWLHILESGTRRKSPTSLIKRIAPVCLSLLSVLATSNRLHSQHGYHSCHSAMHGLEEFFS